MIKGTQEKIKKNKTNPFSIALFTKKWAQLQNLPHSFWSKTESTNQNAKKEAQNLIHSGFKLYIATHQTLGKGRNQKVWKDEGKGGELLSSWVYTINFCPQHLSSLFAGMALYQSVKKVWPSLNWSLKPPNDLYLSGKKIAGLLLESLSLSPLERTKPLKMKTKTQQQKHQSFLFIIGLGFNFLSFPKDQKNATCVGFKNFSSEKYFLFLNQLLKRFSKVSKKASKISLNEKEKTILKEALKAYPHENYLNVTKKGEIVTQKGLVLSWRDL